MDDFTIKLSKEKPPEEIQSILHHGEKKAYSLATQLRLVKEIEREKDAIQEERDEIGYDSFCDMMDAQYKGEMVGNRGIAFNLDTGLSQVKTDDIVSNTVAAFWGVDPIISVKPRPGMAKGNGVEITEQQTDFLDASLDERIPLRKPFRLAVKDAVTKKVGWIKLVHKVRKEDSVRVEHYKAGPEGLENFMLTHGERVSQDPGKYEWVLKRLMGEIDQQGNVIKPGKDTSVEVECENIVYNDPLPIHVDPVNFYVRKDVEGYEGMCETQTYIERIPYTYYELKELEKEHDFINVDSVLYDSDDDEEKKNVREHAEQETYWIWECTHRFKETEDGEYEKIMVWVAEDRRKFLGAISYPLSMIECMYVPIHVSANTDGIYQECPQEKWTDKHLADNAILNFSLTAAYIANMVTPIAPKKSDLWKQFIRNRWTTGIPIEADPGKVRFLNEFIRPPDIGGLLALRQEVTRSADDLSRSSSLRTGRESPMDPSAPASKTAMLLQESGKGMKDYIDEVSKGFNTLARLILLMYAEISQEGVEYIPRRMAQTTGEPPQRISRAVLVARTTIQAQAYTYDFNKLNEKRESLAFYQMMKDEMLVASNPQGWYHIVKTLIKTWSPAWRNALEKILPDPEEFAQQQAQVAMQATAQYFEQKIAVAKNTGQPLDVNPDELIQVINALQARTVGSVEAEMERREAEAKGQ